MEILDLLDQILLHEAATAEKVTAYNYRDLSPSNNGHFFRALEPSTKMAAMLINGLATYRHFSSFWFSRPLISRIPLVSNHKHLSPVYSSRFSIYENPA